MNYYLENGLVLKWLETPSVYSIANDDLYELDEESFSFLKECSSERGCNSDDTEFINYCLQEGILSENRTSGEQPPLVKSPVPSLKYLELQITDKCNLRCRHCYIGDKISTELSLSQIKKILDEFQKMQGLRVLITGGEPLLHSSFDELNRMLPDYFLRKVLFTNGMLLNDDILGRLKVHEVQISIDGLEEAHDALRGSGTYRLAMDAVRRSLDAGFAVSISTMIHKKNLDDFKKMDGIFRDMGIRDWTVDVPCTTGRLLENDEFSVSPEQGGEYLRFGYGEGLHSSSTGFACGLHLLSVMADGRIAKCTFFGENPVGTIDDGLRTCWGKIRPIQLDELRCDCEYLELCRGGCRYRAELFGDPSGKDLYRCRLYDIIK